MKFLLIFGYLVAVAVAQQRPSYAGLTPKVYPGLANRFRDTASTSDAATDNTIVNRISEDDPQTTIKVPVAAAGNVDLVQRLNTWPKENRPFWLLNAEQIEAQKNVDVNSKAGDVGLRASFGTNPSEEFLTIRPPASTRPKASFFRP